jgi:hypothetical protein
MGLLYCWLSICYGLVYRGVPYQWVYMSQYVNSPSHSGLLSFHDSGPKDTVFFTMRTENYDYREKRQLQENTKLYFLFHNIYYEYFYSEKT